MPFRLEVNKNLLEGADDRVRQNLQKVIDRASFGVQARTQGYIREHDLIDTGFMLNSVAVRKLEPLENEVRVGAEYAIYHELGTVHIPARPFLGPAVEDERPDFEEACRQAVEQAFK